MDRNLFKGVFLRRPKKKYYQLEDSNIPRAVSKLDLLTKDDQFKDSGAFDVNILGFIKRIFTFKSGVAVLRKGSNNSLEDPEDLLEGASTPK